MSRLPSASVSLLPALLLGLIVVTWVGAQGPGGSEPPKPRKPRVEEEDDRRPPKGDKGKRPDTEEEGPRPKRKPIRVEDEDDKTRAPAAESDLLAASRDAKNVAVRYLFRAVAVPHDLVTLSAGGGRRRDVRTEPLPDFVTDPKKLTDRLALQPIDAEGKRTGAVTAPADSVLALRYYEQIAQAEAKDFLSKHLETLAPSDPKYLARLDQLVAAEQALSAAARFHASAVEREVRKGPAWAELESALRKDLLAVLLEQLEALADARAWDAGFALTGRLADTFTRPEEAERLAGPVAGLVRKALADPAVGPEQLAARRREVQALDRRFPGSDLLKPVREQLAAQARGLLDQARKLAKDDGGKARARDLLGQAEEAWPNLEGLAELRRELEGFQDLRVGGRELPRFLSPARATTDVELRAVDLLFESLVKLTPSTQSAGSASRVSQGPGAPGGLAGSGILFYRPGLAEGRPKVIPLGREFRLPREAVWSDDVPLTVGDLRHSIRLLQAGKGTGRSAAWGTLVERVQVDRDPYVVRLRLAHGVLDPLAAVSFKLVPQRSRPDPDSEAFARKPVGSGPFRFARQDSQDGREYVAFAASPGYGARAGKAGLPRIRELRLFAGPDPSRDLQMGRVDVAFDLTAEQAAGLVGKPGVAVPLPDGSSPNRRVYFLAANNRRPNLPADLRVALARAIDREKLLDEHLRGPLGRKVHRALNGPYPAGSWACLPPGPSDKGTVDPFDADLARSRLKLALAKLGAREVRLTLKYPSGDPALARAIVALCDQVKAELPAVRLEPVERTPQDLRQDVEGTFDYDLAYYSHDFPDESFWLLPLLGPAGRDGAEGMLGYTGPLVEKIQSSLALRNFAQVREYAHAVHRDFLDREMPFIPLWQLDPLWAYMKDRVEVPALDPRQPFADIDLWRVTGRTGKPG